jgi:cobalt-zinc-cadmium efflux system outer membrane protein
MKAAVLKSRQSTLKSEEKLASMLGIRGDTFANLTTAPLLEPPKEIPAPEVMREALLANHPGLSRLRLKYEVCEAQLRLEISKQYPDFHFGPTLSKEGGERKTSIGLSLGIDLPIFDRNQQGIASASQSREEARAKYEAEATRALSALEGSLKQLKSMQERYAHIHTGLVPKAQEHLQNTRKALGAGNVDQLRLLEAERGVRSARLEELEAETELRGSWIALERAVGVAPEILKSEIAEPTPPGTALPTPLDPRPEPGE